MATFIGLPTRINSTSGTRIVFPNSSAAFEIEYFDLRSSRTAPMGLGNVPANRLLPVPQTPKLATENFSWPLGESGTNFSALSIIDYAFRARPKPRPDPPSGAYRDTRLHARSCR